MRIGKTICHFCQIIMLLCRSPNRQRDFLRLYRLNLGFFRRIMDGAVLPPVYAVPFIRDIYFHIALDDFAQGRVLCNNRNLFFLNFILIVPIPVGLTGKNAILAEEPPIAKQAERPAQRQTQHQHDGDHCRDQAPLTLFLGFRHRDCLRHLRRSADRHTAMDAEVAHYLLAAVGAEPLDRLCGCFLDGRAAVHAEFGFLSQCALTSGTMLHISQPFYTHDC